MRELVEQTPAGKLRFNFHRGQWKAWNSEQRVVLVLAGTQGGKTSFGPVWLWREIARRGPGDYLVVTPTFPLLELKALPEFKRLFLSQLQLGTYVGGPVRKFMFSAAGSMRTFGWLWNGEATNVYFGHAQDPDSLESATVKAAWLDEAGQKKFRLASWEAIQRRLAIHRGRVLITTTPYDLGWLKQKVFDPWKRGDREIDVVGFASSMNPKFPKEEFERARRDLPAWKFGLFYLAQFTRPAGLIYDCFDSEQDTCPPFKIEASWPRYLGLDFGGTHTAGLFYAEDPKDGKLYLYREYLAGSRTAQEHAAELLRGEPGIPFCVGGAGSEDQWRREFGNAGLPVREPDQPSVEVGIDRAYGAHKRREIVVFSTLSGYLEQIQTYSRVVDSTGEPTEEIEDKNAFHFMDAERYIVGWVKRGGGKVETGENPFF